MTEKEYRALEIDSYSSIKVFVEDRKKYYKEFILKEPVRDKDTESTTFGSLVDCIKFAPNEFEERFVTAVAQVPTGQYYEFVKELMRFTILSLDESGTVTRDLEPMMRDAYDAVKFDKNGNEVAFKRDSFDIVKGKFIGSNLEVYYQQLRSSYGKNVIEISDLDNAQRVVNELNSNFVTKEIMNVNSNFPETIEVQDQFPIIGSIPGKLVGSSSPYSLKGLIDRLVIDHITKTVSIFDLKTCWDNEGEFLTNYFKYKYYIQATVYYYLVTQYVITHDSLEGYSVNYPKFIVAESNNYKNPLIYNTNKNNIKQGWNGFTIRGKYYPGVKKAITDLVWHKETGIWNISKDNYERKGIVEISPFVEH